MAAAESDSENILKQGFLKKYIQTADLLPSAPTQFRNSIKQKLEPLRWYVFGVRNRKPYLELYEKEESMFTGPPLNSFDLSTFQSLSYTMGRTNSSFNFCIFLADFTIELTAPSRNQMLDWCRCLERNLRNLGLRSKDAKDEHHYMAFPVKKPEKKPSPAISLPATPSQVPGVFLEELDTDNLEHHNYDDTADKKLESKDENDNSFTTPPKLPPKRKVKHEDIFFALNTVKRRNKDEDKLLYNNLNTVSDVEIVDSDLSESSDSEYDSVNDEDSDDEFEAFQEKHKDNVNVGNERNEEDLFRSLPITPSKSLESDTSEDSDFVSASFWLRNRKPEAFSNNANYIHPVVSYRKEAKRNFPRNCMSMDFSLLNTKCINRQDNTEAGIHSDNSKDCHNSEMQFCFCNACKADNIKKTSSEKFDAEVFYNAKDKTNSNYFVEDNCEKLAAENEKKHFEKAKINQLKNSEVHKSTWECVNRNDLKNSDAVVDLEQGQRNFIQQDCMMSGTQTIDSNLQQQKSNFSNLFARQSQDKELSQSLAVTLPPMSSSVDGNVSSDLPNSDSLPHSATRSHSQLDSNLLKLSLDNNPSVEPDILPVLPKRNQANSTKISTVLSPGYTKSPPCNNVSSAFKSGACHKNKDPCDISHCSEEIWDAAGSKPEEIAPVALPYRTRKSLISPISAHSNGSFDVKLPEKSPLIPEKHFSMTRGREANKDPILPPRNYITPTHDKLLVPPQPRRELLSRTTSDVGSFNEPPRPVTVHLSTRQQSCLSPGPTVMNLKQNQVDILKAEIESIDGLRKIISKVQFMHGLALVECFGKIWIAGWNVKKYPRLHDKFHIGDALLSINDVQVSDLLFVNKLVKNIQANEIEISIRRLPNAKVFAIQKHTEGECLGFKRNRDTAEISNVDPLGLMYKHGLTNKTMTMDGMAICTWTLTEINARPLNLFCKGKEIEQRLLAVGHDISIVVQPTEFIMELKSQIKKIREYKDYLLQ